jgi:pSer/pThr/pTyr-binding forkhead associated (FHA) protein
VVGADGAALEDLGSKNGTKLQGQKIREVSPLKDRDVIQIGPASMVLRVYRAAGTTETAIEDDRVG